MGVAGQLGIDGDQWAQCVQDRGWLWNAAAGAVKTAEPATLILAHGAGAPMDSDWMTGMAERLAARGLNVLRFEFPYMAQRRLDGGKRPPNQQAKLLDCWREVYAEVRRHVAGRLAIGGKSMGGRMASLVADEPAWMRWCVWAIRFTHRANRKNPVWRIWPSCTRRP